MADRAISALPTATTLTASDLFVLSQGNQAKNTTWQTIIGYLTTALDGHGGIQSIAKTSTSGVVDTYTLTLADETTYTFTVTNGDAVSTITQYYAVSTSDSTAPETWYTTLQTMTPTYKYLWSYMHYVFDSGDTLDSTAAVIGVYGDTGQAWYVHIKYSSQQPTSDSDMGDIPDNWIGIYSGTSSTAPTHYTDYDWFEFKGEKGDTGDASAITSQSVDYMESTSGTVVPSGSWTPTIPSVTQGNFLWTRTILNFNDGSTVTSYSVSRYGVDGLGSVVSVNSIGPDGTGNVSIVADDIPTDDNTSVQARIDGLEDIAGDGVLSGFTATDLTGAANELRTSLNSFVRPNLFDNWYFVGGGSQVGDGNFPINQRGNSSYNSTGYMIDRWKSQATTSAHTFTVRSDCVRSSRTIATTNPQFFCQKLSSVLPNDTYTVSIMYKHNFTADNIIRLSVRDSDGNVIGENKNVPPSNNYSLLSFTVTGSPVWLYTQDFSANLGVGSENVGKYIDIIAIKLELGDTQTLAHQENGVWVLNEIPDYADQMLRCCSSTSDSSDTYANKPYNDLMTLTYLVNRVPSSIIADANTYTAGVQMLARTDANTLNTPYKQGLTSNSAGFIITYGGSDNYCSQLAMAAGKTELFTRAKANGTWGLWISFGAFPITIAQGGTGSTGIFTTSTVSDILTAASGATIVSADFAQWGKLAQLRVAVKYNQSIPSTDVTLATLKSGKKPAVEAAVTMLNAWSNAVCYISGGSSGGAIKVRTGGTISANTEMYLNAIYLLV